MTKVLRIGFAFRSKTDSGDYIQDSFLMKRVVKETTKHAKVEVLNFDRFEANIENLGNEFDGICTMSRNPTALSLLSCMELRGISCVNTVSSIRKSLDRASTLATLRQHRIQVPETSVHRRSFSALKLPVILKNTVSTGVRGRRTIIIRSTRDITRYSALLRNGLWISQKLVQEIVLSKVYVIKDDVIAVKKEGVLGPKPVIGDGVELDRGSIDMCILCGSLIGLDIFNVELLSDRNDTYVIDVNDFPSFSGFSKASTKISSYLLEKFKK